MDKLIAEFEELGEAEVREGLALGRYSMRRADAARTWLEGKAADRAHASLTEQIEIARSAKDAAWNSAKAAHSANTRATWALMVAIVSAIATSVMAYLAWAQASH